MIGAEWGGGGFSDVGGARNAALYSSLHTYILHERRRERLRIGTDRIDYDYELLFALRFFSDWFVMFFFVFFSFVSYPSRCASSAVCVGADGILVFSVLPVLSRSLK